MIEKVMVQGRRLGKLAKKEDKRNLSFAKYAATTLMPEPAVDFSTLIGTWPMFGNDQYGDCTCAAIGHMVMLLSAMADEAHVVTPTDQDVLQYYFDLDNNGKPFQPGASQDGGAYILDVLNFWKKTGMGGVSPFAFVEVNTQNLDEVKVAAGIFGGLDIGIRLPVSAQSQNIWDIGGSGDTDPGSWGGHSVNVVGYDAGGLTVVTWGNTKRMTWPFWQKYVDESYAVLPDDWQHRVDGFDWTDLQQDLQELSSVQ